MKIPNKPPQFSKQNLLFLLVVRLRDNKESNLQIPEIKRLDQEEKLIRDI